VDIKNPQNGDKGEQTEAQAEDRLQANGEREIDVGVDVDQTRAPATTLGLVRVEADRDFLEGSVSGVEFWKLANTYGDCFNNGVSNRERAKTASKTTKDGGTLADGDNDLGGKESRARVIRAATVLGKDGVALVAEVVEGVLDVGIGPLRNGHGS